VTTATAKARRDKGTAKTADGGPAAISRAVVLAPGEYTGGGTATGSPAPRPRPPVYSRGANEARPQALPRTARKGGVLAAGGFEAASSRLPAARAAYSLDLLGRGRHDGAMSPPFSSVSPLRAGFRGRVRNPAAEARQRRASPLEAGSRKTRQPGWGCRPVFLGLKGRG
jgi:hypothetical protein